MQNSTRKFFLAGAIGLALTASAVDTPTAKWGNWFDGTTTAGDNTITHTYDSDGNLIFLNTISTTSVEQDAFYAGEKIFTGALGEKTTNNLALTKTDADGKAKWTIYTNSGDLDSGQGGVAIAKDGSIYFLAKVRHTDSDLEHAVTFVDATGAQFEIGDKVVAENYYFFVLGKADSNGAIQWLREIPVSTTPVVNNGKDFIYNGAYAKAFTLDSEGNIFIGGNMRTAITFPKEDGTTTTLTPRNIATWNGDSQGTVGDMFIVRLDSNGYFSDALTTDGAIQGAEQVFDFTTDDSALYFTGLINPTTEGSAATLDGKELPIGSVHTPFVGSLNPSTMTINWVTTLKGETVDDNSAYQNPSIEVVGSTLWLVAQCNGAYTSSSNNYNFATSQGKLREGILVRINASNGDIENAVASRTGFEGTAATALTGYCGVVQNASHPERVYVYGYGMNTAVGCYLRSYDSTTLEPDAESTWTLLAPQNKGTATALVIAYNPNAATITVTGRCNKSMLPLGGEESAAPNAWGVYAANFAMPDVFQSGVDSPFADGNNVLVSTGKGHLTLSASSIVNTAVVDVLGRVVTNVTVTPESPATVQLAPGIYIVAGHKVLVK